MRPEHDLSLAELFERYVTRQAGRFAEGDAAELTVSGATGGEVFPHDAVPAQAIDPRLAWDEALAALTLGRPGAGGLPGPCSAPEWRSLVASQEPAVDLAFCAGNFPQMVRNLSLLLQEQTPGKGPEAWAASRTRPFQNAELTAWSEGCVGKPFPQPLLAVGMLRLAQEFERASALLRRCDADVPAEWRAAWRNEEAALAWHAGQRSEAVELWKKGDGGHLPTQFNLGMASLFLGRPTDARGPLGQAVAQLPEDNSWHHLGRLYLTLAEMRAGKTR